MKNLKRAFQILIVILANPLFGSDTIVPRIDTHIHLYDTRREGSSTFLDPVKHEKIYFPHFASTFLDTAGPAGVNYAVVVEASQRREDNYWLMQHVDTSNALLAFIANLDPRDPFYVADLDSLCTYEKFRGIRIRPTTPINIADASIMASFAHLARKNLVLELGGNGVDPKTITAIARRFPNMNIIMNHLAGIRMQGDQVAPGDYVARLTEFAREPNVYCKISALYTLIGQSPAPANPDVYKPIIDPVIDAFGPDRVLFGSNWTLSDMHGSYRDMIVMLDQYLDGRGDVTPQMFYYENINRAYGINRLESVNTGTIRGLTVSELLSVFPNPASAQLYIYSNEQAFDRLRIMDMQGRMVFQHRERTRELKLDVSEWMAGIYLLESTLDRIRTFQKIVIN
jgi:L-fuconolactonase